MFPPEKLKVWQDLSISGTHIYMRLFVMITKLTELPELPDFLQGLSCSENQLKSLPDLPNICRY